MTYQTIDTTSLPAKTSYSCSLGSSNDRYDNDYTYNNYYSNNRYRRRTLLQSDEDSALLEDLTRGTRTLAGASAREIAETNGQLLKRLGRQFASGLSTNRWDSATERQGSQAVGTPHRRRWLVEQQPVNTPLVSGTATTQASTASQATVALPGGLRDCCKANPDCTDQLSVIVTHIDYSAAIQGLAGLNLLGLGSVRVVSSMVSVLFTSSAGTPVALSCTAHPFEVTVPLQSQLYIPGAPGTTECWELQQNGTSLTGTTSRQTTLLKVVGGTATCAPTSAGTFLIVQRGPQDTVPTGERVLPPSKDVRTAAIAVASVLISAVAVLLACIAFILFRAWFRDWREKRRERRLLEEQSRDA
ncbi:hypothetical protein KFL_000230350 [Klebsormidium nitens]|uniref:Uncharacterized protein n=1 Tax=Klebsormidium nitens TaxID=105231 RepID=A0A1Y1HR35_KLENI|nr:hypothetical protein KFL_000230350 [Klebsormidium nitens]|eukprot:GAQ79056.1 hypothetical protein KFL_000230350 [Klebsormidium nitens]